MKTGNKIFIMPAVFLMIVFLLSSFLAEQNYAGDISKDEVIQEVHKLQIPFIANKGQIDEKVAFYVNAFGGSVFITKDGEIVYLLPFKKSDLPGFDDTCERRLVLKEEFEDKRGSWIKGEGENITKISYFKGKDTINQKSNIPTYEIVTLGDVYKGIDLKVKACGNNIEKLFCVKPDGNPVAIKIKLSGADGVKVNEKGELEAETEFGLVKFTKPVAYQEIDGKRVNVDVEYQIEKRKVHMVANLNPKIQNPTLEYGFKVAPYDKTKELVIDPLLASTYLGGSSDDSVSSMTIDSAGNIYLTGETLSPDFPTTTGSYDVSDGSSVDAFVSKFSGDLTHLLASTYLGGSSTDHGCSIAVGLDGNIYVAGSTGSTDFPTTIGAYNTFLKSLYHSAFVSKLSGDLTHLIASTYLGGSSYDSVSSLAVDKDGNVYVAGETSSSDFPKTPGAYSTPIDGFYNDAFVSKLSSDLTRLLASSHFGGPSYDYPSSIAIDQAGNIYVAGGTRSTSFPVTAGSYCTSSSSNYSIAFISKLSGNLERLLASTYLCGSSGDFCNSIALDAQGNIYVTGYTKSTNFPTTPGACCTYNTGSYNIAFVSKINGDLTRLLASTYLGGADDDYGKSIAIDSSGNIYVTGCTKSKDFPITINARHASIGISHGDAFVSKINGDLTYLLASTYLGGSSYDSANAVTIDSSGNVYIAGNTKSSDFPTTIVGYDTFINGISDVFVSKFDGNLSDMSPKQKQLP